MDMTPNDEINTYHGNYNLFLVTKISNQEDDTEEEWITDDKIYA